jgi:PAS domain S-box-containing protein
VSRLDVAADSVPDGGEWDRCWSALDPLPTAISLWDEALCCRYANPAALRWLGAPVRDDVLGQRAEALLPPETWQAVRVHARAALTGHLGQFDCTVPAATGAPSRLHVICSPYEVAGRPCGVFLQVLDVTARARAEEDQRLLSQEAAVERALDRVGDRAAHLISRRLFAATLELSAVLQRGAAREGMRTDPADQARVRAALEDINAAVIQLRSLAVPARGQRLLADDRDGGAPRPDMPRPRRHS